MPRKPQRLSAAAMKREREQLLADRAAPRPPLPAPFTTWLHQDYQPKPELQPLWRTDLLPFVEQTLTASSVRGLESLRKHATHVAYFGSWAHRKGLTLELATVCRANTDEYCRVGMAGSSEKSSSDRRSRLRAIADDLHPEQAPPPAVAIPRKDLRPPYTEAEMQAIRRVSGVQPTLEMCRQLSICVGLGAGAGIDSPDLRLLHRNDVKDHGDAGIAVHVPGDRARIVWVLRSYEPIVRRGLAGLASEALLIGRVQDRRNVAGDVFNRATLVGNLPTLDQSRLRTTWLATLMSRPVSLAVILQAAGLKSTRTLFDLLPYLPTFDDAAALREGGAL